MIERLFLGEAGAGVKEGEDGKEDSDANAGDGGDEADTGFANVAAHGAEDIGEGDGGAVFAAGFELEGINHSGGHIAKAIGAFAAFVEGDLDEGVAAEDTPLAGADIADILEVVGGSPGEAMGLRIEAEEGIIFALSTAFHDFGDGDRGMSGIEAGIVFHNLGDLGIIHLALEAHVVVGDDFNEDIGIFQPALIALGLEGGFESSLARTKDRESGGFDGEDFIGDLHPIIRETDSEAVGIAVVTPGVEAGGRQKQSQQDA